MRARLRGWLLLGPTGSGKTPLGRLLEERGIAGQSCFHFDFGEYLRRIADGQELGPVLSSEEKAVIRFSLKTGALLEDRDFPVALKILGLFACEKKPDRNGLVILNGLPRHLGQARMLEPFVIVEAVVILEAPPEVIRERIRRDPGGDRGGRQDDSLPEVERKFRVYEEKTLPLIDFYESRGAAVLRMPVGTDSTASDLYQFLEKTLKVRKP